MNVFDIKASVQATESSIAFLQELLKKQAQLLLLEKELEALLLASSQFDPLDQEWITLDHQVDFINRQILSLRPSKVDGAVLKARDLIPVLLHSLDANVNTLVSVHCGTPQSATHCGYSADEKEIFIC